MGNILDNAVKYTEQGGIIIRTKRYELFTAVEVEDTGPGLLEERSRRSFKDSAGEKRPWNRRAWGSAFILPERSWREKGDISRYPPKKEKVRYFPYFCRTEKKKIFQNCHN